MKPEELSYIAGHDSGRGRVSEADAFARLDDLQRIYQQFTADYDGFVIRSRENWQLLLEDGALDNTVCYIIEEDGRAEGYCFWAEQDGCVFIREMAWCCEEARVGLLRHLWQTVPSNQNMWLELADDDALAGQLAVSKTAVVRHPFLMARIADVPMCLEAIHYPKDVEASFELAVFDYFILGGTSVYSVSISNGRANVRKTKCRQGDLSSAVYIGIEGLSQLVTGARSVKELVRQKLLVCPAAEQELLDWLWPKQCLYINEYY